MRLKSAIEAANTRKKLAALEAHYQAARERHGTNAVADQVVLYSLRRMINQLKEEVIRYECDVRSGKLPHEAAVASEDDRCA